MADEDPQELAEDALQVAQRALAKVNGLEDTDDPMREELERMQRKQEEFRDELTALALRVSEVIDKNDYTYAQLTLDEKIGLVREYAFRKATDGHGRAKIDYDDVMWGVFDGEPGANHCYKLLRLAAGLTDADSDRPTGGEIPGFRCRDPDDENYHVAVDAEQAKESEAFYPRNKTATEGVGSR